MITTSSIPIFNRYARDYDNWYVKHADTAESEVKAVSMLIPRGASELRLALAAAFSQVGLAYPWV
ncbi:hypothetical protein [Vulcanisaeta distributa]|uniref:hypothetical protein n=1 Tax=Vulcanisaeta distributa TaxID=164451 RepID=UPI000A6A243E|nr:hypothetical protein [Vulcanisaeta distributa]